MDDPIEVDDFDCHDCDDQSVMCPKCSGDGTVICHCGGDLCVCENFGDAPCPLCHEEGVVSTELAEKFLAARRRAWEAFQKAAAPQKE